MKYTSTISLLAVLLVLPHHVLCGRKSGEVLNKEAFLERNINKTTKVLESEIRVFCAVDGVDVTFKRNNVLKLGVIVQTQLKLSSPSCVSTANYSHFLLHTSFQDCGSEVYISADNTSATIKNKVIVDPPTTLFLTDDEDSIGEDNERSVPAQIAFTCTYSIKSAGTTTIPSSVLKDVEEIASATIDIYSTDSYSSEVDLQQEISRGTSLYVKIKGFSGDDRTTNFQINSCYLSTNSRYDTVVYPEIHYLIKDGCESDKDVQIKEDTENSPRKFLFRAKRLYGNKAMYLHCSLVPCDDIQCGTQQSYCNNKLKELSPPVIHTSTRRGMAVVKRNQRRIAVATESPTHTTLDTTTKHRRPLNSVKLSLPSQCPTVEPSTTCVCTVAAVADMISTNTLSGMVTMEVAIVIAVISFIIGAVFIAIIWFIHNRTKPGRKRQTVSISDDGLSSQESTVPTEKLMKHSSDITSSEESN